MLTVLGFAAAFGVSRRASAQAATFHLDRLVMGGAPDDSFALFRPNATRRSVLFASTTAGFALAPLREQAVASAGSPLASRGDPLTSQLVVYVAGGVELGEWATVVAVVPFAAYETTGNPPPASSRDVNVRRQAMQDARLDLRFTFVGGERAAFRLAAAAELWLPTGDPYSYGSDAQTTGGPALSAEWNLGGAFLVANAGVRFRPPADLGELHVGTEARVALGAFVPLREGRARLGVVAFGSTGLERATDASGASRATFLAAKSSPAEWLGEGRFALDDASRLWLSAAAGTRLDLGYGAPDVRALASIGGRLPVGVDDPELARRPPPRPAREVPDADRDGISDDVDICPAEPEDGKNPEPHDGCPLPPDRDGDGVEDVADACPDVAEDRDGFDDGDGCPDDDVDHDGVLDAADACPREPGRPSGDPKQNGCPQGAPIPVDEVMDVRGEIAFQLARATLQKGSARVLDAVVATLAEHPEITRVRVEGHTDDRGDPEKNRALSQARADAVRDYFVKHGVAAERVEAVGFGSARPIVSNATPEGRVRNRRVEIHVAERAR